MIAGVGIRRNNWIGSVRYGVLARSTFGATRHDLPVNHATGTGTRRLRVRLTTASSSRSGRGEDREESSSEKDD